MQIVKDLLRISESDLKASRILYYSSLYPQSVFLFQQSCEKANKALGVTLGILDPKKVGQFGHDQIQIYQSGVSQQIELLNSVPWEKLIYPLAVEAGIDQLPSDMKNLNLFLEEVKKESTSVPNSNDLDFVLESIWKTEDYSLDIPKNISHLLKESIPQIKEYFNSLNLDIGKDIKEFESYLSNEKNQYELNNALEKILDYTLKFGKAILTLSLLSIVTQKHSTTPRYPTLSKTPFKLYNSRSPIIKSLPEFQDALENSIAV